MNINKDILLLNRKRAVAVIIAWLVSVVLHNLVSAWLGFEEAVFFIIAIFLIPLYLVFSLVYTAVKKLK